LGGYFKKEGNNGMKKNTLLFVVVAALALGTLAIPVFKALDGHAPPGNNTARHKSHSAQTTKTTTTDGKTFSSDRTTMQAGDRESSKTLTAAILPTTDAFPARDVFAAGGVIRKSYTVLTMKKANAPLTTSTRRQFAPPLLA
jgi:hypothetical protein